MPPEPRAPTTTRSLLPSAPTTTIVLFPPAIRVRAMSCPPGDQAGRVSPTPVLVKWRTSLPSAFATTTEEMSDRRDGDETYAIIDPFGDQAGSEA